MVKPGRILLTGAAGFVGSHLTLRLRKAFPDNELILCGTGHEALDITDDAAVQALVMRSAPQACVHLAAVTTVPAARRDPVTVWRVNLDGTLSLARAIMRYAPSCVLLYISSAEIYGHSFASGRPLDETAAPAPMNTYAATKAAADLALGAMVGEGLRVIRARSFNHTGPGQSAEFVVPAFARQVARIAAGRQEPILQVGALDPFRDFLDVRDVCDAYVECLRRAEALPPGAVFNIASGTPRRVGDVLQNLLDLAGIEATITTGAALLRPSDMPVARGDAGLAGRLLQWSPRIAWTDTLQAVLADWRERIANET